MRRSLFFSGTYGHAFGRIVFLALLHVATPAQADSPTLTPAQIAQAATPSVVLIKTPIGLGSGFIVTADGKIVTNFHVIRDVNQATVTTADGKAYQDVEVMALDPARDLAVLRTAARTPRPLILGDSGQVQPGEHVVAIGNPLGFGDTVSDGLLSAVRKLPQITLLQISAPISHGSSGGPVFNDHGQVIGVSALVVAGGQNLNFAIPINAVKGMLAGDKGRKLASYPTAPQHRDIPNYPVSMLDDCQKPQLETVVNTISRAIGVGAPLYNEGNLEACYRIYEGAALELQRTAPQCPGPTKALADGISRADRLAGWSEKAWAMRDAFDGVLDVVQRSKSGGMVQRHVPLVGQSVFEHCPSKDVSAIADAISSAIDSGAPLFNAGNTEACVRIYAGAISQIDRTFDRCPAVRQVLQAGITNADNRDGWPAKAWALRDAFDGLMNAIGTFRAHQK